jgi:mono/diheme cytochrome c family protein
MRSVMLPFVAFAVFTAAAVAPSGEQPTRSHVPPLVISSLAGHDLFEFYCASCHGRSGRGDGPVAPSLKTAPSDLTRLALRNGGQFPTARVTAYVLNDADVRLTSHGSYEMPVWGPVFRSLDGSDRLARVRIANVVAYLESIQERPTH